MEEDTERFLLATISRDDPRHFRGTRSLARARARVRAPLGVARYANSICNFDCCREGEKSLSGRIVTKCLRAVSINEKRLSIFGAVSERRLTPRRRPGIKELFSINIDSYTAASGVRGLGGKYWLARQN